jgi:hypothetical protein
VSESGAFVIRHTRDGQLLAIAANQPGSHDNRLVYVGVLPAVVTIMDLRGMGTRFPLTQNSRYALNLVLDFKILVVHNINMICCVKFENVVWLASQ